MFRKNSRNSFLQKTLPRLSKDVIQGNMNQVLYRFLEESKNPIETVQSFQDYDDEVRVGFGKNGICLLVCLDLILFVRL